MAGSMIFRDRVCHGCRMRRHGHAAAPAQWPAVGKATARGYSDMGPGPTAPRCLPRLALCSWLREQLATAERGGSGRLPAGGVPSSVRRRRRPLGASSLPPTARASRPSQSAAVPCAGAKRSRPALRVSAWNQKGMRMMVDASWCRRDRRSTTARGVHVRTT